MSAPKGFSIYKHTPQWVDFILRTQPYLEPPCMYVRAFRITIDGCYIVHVVTPFGTEVLIGATKEAHQANVDLAMQRLEQHKIGPG